MQGIKPAFNRRNFCEKTAGFLYIHLQNIMDIFSFITNIKGFLIKPLALTYIAGYIHIRQEVHLDLDRTIAMTVLAASSCYIKREPSGFIPAGLCFWKSG